jgi:hypothetical protein
MIAMACVVGHGTLAWTATFPAGVRIRAAESQFTRAR